MKIIIFHLFFVSSISAITFKCDFPLDSLRIQCVVQDLQNTDNMYLTNITNNFENGIYGLQTTVNGVVLPLNFTGEISFENLPELTFFPQKLENYMSFLESIQIINSGIEYLDLSVFNQQLFLTNLIVTGNTKLTTIFGSFSMNLIFLDYLDFSGNNIATVGTMSLILPSQLLYFNVEGNTCIRTINTTTDILAIVEILRKNCVPGFNFSPGSSPRGERRMYDIKTPEGQAFAERFKESINKYFYNNSINGLKNVEVTRLKNIE